MSIQRKAVGTKTKYLLLIIFSAVLSVNIAFSEEDDYIPIRMTAQDYADNCAALFTREI